MKRMRLPQLYLLVKEQIANYILKERLSPGALLPPEGQLCTHLKISRGTLREAMRILEEEGVVIRRQGVGTFVCDSKNLIRSTLDINESVSEMLTGRGMEPGSQDVKIEKIEASAKLAEVLAVNPGGQVFSVTRVRTANGLPIAQTFDFLPVNAVPETFAEDFKGGSLYTYLEEELGIEITNSLVRIQPLRASKGMTKSLCIKPGTLLLFLRQTDKDPGGTPLLYSEEYFIADRFEFIVYRRRKRPLRMQDLFLYDDGARLHRSNKERKDEA
jgi:GntR family transcriptional regulator